MLRKNATQIIKTLNRTQRYSNQSLKLKNPYPYRFGGVESKQDNGNVNLFMRQLFGQTIKQGFKSAYLATLSAIRDKDKHFIQEAMSAPLAKHFDLIDYIDLELINPQSSVQVNLHRYFMGVGGVINRSGQKCKALMFKNIKQGVDVCVFPSTISNFPVNNMPIILGCQVYLRSSTKLLKSPAKDPNNSPQYHMLQFQIQNIVKMPQMVKIFQQLSSGKAQNYNQNKQLIKKFVGQNYEWKITDIDLFLKGNLELLAHGGDGGGLGKFF